ncbi:MAG: MOSC domain-containing protein [Actinomycetota bacterium]|nr:MOSC domain-containing protein [Actinomycetota bacterium]
MQRSIAELEPLLDHILSAPKDSGTIELLVRRPAESVREKIESAELDTEVGVVGDNWLDRAREAAGDGVVSKHAQLTLMNSRSADAVAVDRGRWPLCGDQIYVDMDLSMENLPAGSRIKVGTATVEISEVPHTGCPKFSSRFGAEALRFVNVGDGRANRLRGVNAFIVESGTVSLGDVVKKL